MDFEKFILSNKEKIVKLEKCNCFIIFVTDSAKFETAYFLCNSNENIAITVCDNGKILDEDICEFCNYDGQTMEVTKDVPNKNTKINLLRKIRNKLSKFCFDKKIDDKYRDERIDYEARINKLNKKVKELTSQLSDYNELSMRNNQLEVANSQLKGFNSKLQADVNGYMNKVEAQAIIWERYEPVVLRINEVHVKLQSGIKLNAEENIIREIVENISLKEKNSALIEELIEAKSKISRIESISSQFGDLNKQSSDYREDTRDIARSYLNFCLFMTEVINKLKIEYEKGLLEKTYILCNQQLKDFREIVGERYNPEEHEVIETCVSEIERCEVIESGYKFKDLVVKKAKVRRHKPQ